MTHCLLRSNAFAEPLVNRWYAWPMLLSPAQLALITLHSQVSILQSYIQMPKMHEMALKNPSMRGGPFINFEGQNRATEVKTFLDEVMSSPLIALAKSLDVLNKMVLNTPDGHSLSALYSDIPELLRGYVELVYDLNNRPHFRLLEGLLYRSSFYDVKSQSMLLSTLQGDTRSFVLSTPRLCTDEALHWTIPFASSAIDTLFAARERPIEKTALATFFSNHFEDTATNKAQFMSLFQDASSKIEVRDRRYQGDAIRIRYFGHACVLIETNKTTILVDAMVSYGYETDLPRFTYDDLPEHIDYVILTHSHQDHVMLEHLLQLRYKIGTVVVPKNASGMLQDPSLKLMFKTLRFNQVIELDEMESITLPDGEMLGIPFFGEHGDLYIQSKMAYILQLKGKTLLFAADSDNLEPYLYQHIHALIPKIDMIFLGMECDGAPMSWLYGSLLGAPLSRTMDQSRRLNGSNCERAMEIIRQFDCYEVYVYAMGKEPWLGYITSIEYTDDSYPIVESNQLIQTCEAEGRQAQRLYLKKEWFLT